MYKITVVALPGCELCETLIKKLQEDEMEFNIALADEHVSLCDMLEVLLHTKTYPIVTYEIPERAFFICMPHDASRLGWKVLDDTSTSIGVTSVETIYDTITQLNSKL
jgi:hypothetical protein